MSMITFEPARSNGKVAGDFAAWIFACIWSLAKWLCRMYKWVSFGRPLQAGAPLKVKCHYYIRGCLCAVFIAGSAVSLCAVIPYVRSVTANWDRVHACVRKAIYYEAAKEPEFGQVLVGFSIQGRAEMGAHGEGGYPADPCDVTTQKGAPTKRWVTVGKGKNKQTYMVWDCADQYKGMCYAAKVDPQGPLWKKAGESATEAMIAYYFLPQWMRRYTFFATHPPAWWEKKLKLDCNLRFGGHTFCSQPETQPALPVVKSAPPVPPHKPLHVNMRLARN